MKSQNFMFSDVANGEMWNNNIVILSVILQFSVFLPLNIRCKKGFQTIHFRKRFVLFSSILYEVLCAIPKADMFFALKIRWILENGDNLHPYVLIYRGSAEATKQAHNLITALIKDPDVDILTMLPKTTKTTSSATTLWDKTQIGVSLFLIFHIQGVTKGSLNLFS